MIFVVKTKETSHYRLERLDLIELEVEHPLRYVDSILYK